MGKECRGVFGKAREEQKGDRAKKKKRAGVLKAVWAAAGVLFYLAVGREREGRDQH